MSEFNITVEGGSSIRLPTAGKYCDRDIVITADGGAEPVIKPLVVAENGTYTAPDGVDGYSPVTVNVPERTPVVVPLVANENGTYSAQEGTDGYSEVTVEVPLSPLSVTKNGEYVAEKGGYSSVKVNTPSTNEHVTHDIDFRVSAIDVPADFKLNNFVNGRVESSNANGYASFSGGADSYCCIGSMNDKFSPWTSDYLRYAVIKYRSHGSTLGEFYACRDGVQWTSPYGSRVSWEWVADSEWHLALVDARYVWGNVSEHLHAFRFDFNGQVDVAYIKFFAEKYYAEAFLRTEQKVWEVVRNVPVNQRFVYNSYERYYTGTDNVSVTDHPYRIIASYPIAPQNLADGIYRFFETNPQALCTELADQYLAQNNWNLVDEYGNGWLFRGWVNPASMGFDIIAFGYLVDESTYYQSETFVQKDDGLISEIGSTSARRFLIKLNPTHIAENGIHQVRLVVVLSDNNIYELSSFGTFWIQKNANYVDGDLNVYRTVGAKITKNGKTIDAIIAGQYNNQNNQFLAYNPQIEVFQKVKGYNGEFVYPDAETIIVEDPLPLTDELDAAPVILPLNVTENSEYLPGEGVDGFSSVTVEVQATGGGS